MPDQPVISVDQCLVVNTGQEDIAEESPYRSKLQLKMNLVPGSFLTGFSDLKVA